MLHRSKVVFYFAYLVPLLLFIALQLLNFDGLYGQDSYEYIRYTRALKSFFSGGEYPGDLVWPKGYPILIVLFSYLFPLVFSAQLINLLSFYGIAYFLQKIIRLNHGSNKESLVMLLPLVFLLSPYMLRLSLVVMADTLSIFCLLAAVYYSFLYQKQASLKRLTAFVFFASLAVFCRYAALIPLLPFLIWIAFLWFKERKFHHALAFIPGFLLLSIHFYLEGNGSDFSNHYFIENWSVGNFFRRTFILDPSYQLPDEHYLLPNLLYYFLRLFHPGFFLLSLPAILIFRKNWSRFFSGKSRLFFISTVLYVLFLSGITFQSPRYLSLIYPFFLLLIFPSIVALFEKFKKKKTFFILSLTLIQLLLFAKAFYPFYQMNQFEQYLAKELRPYQSNVLYSFEVDIALQNRGLDFDYRSLWSESYEDFQEGAYVLFNPERISERFGGMNPMVNWENMKQSKELVEVKEFNQAWKLYRIEP